MAASDGVIGTICVGSSDRGYRFSGDDSRLLATIANHATVAVGNTALFSSLQEAYLATVRSLAEAVDAKDPYTRGHSDHVARYAMAIADQLGLPAADKTALEMAAYLHDIGKIGIREDVLRKPGALDDAECVEMRHHPLIGASILRPVAFPWPITAIVRHHHEHFDGTGYPAGLKGEDIPVLARILAVADAFEAMTSDRPYRRALVAQQALDELRRCAGTQFDGSIVEAFDPVAKDLHAQGIPDVRAGEEIDIGEVRAIFVTICDGMLESFRGLGGPFLVDTIETRLNEFFRSAPLPYRLRDRHMTVAWDRTRPLDVLLAEMRTVVARMAGEMEVTAGRSLVDHFYGETVSGLSDRMARVATTLDLYETT
jgi:putative nucleotidyltransferase with HDIG domain